MTAAPARPVAHEEASDLLWTTAANTTTGRIATPYGAPRDDGYTLLDALCLLAAGRSPRVDTHHGVTTLTVHVNGIGEHAWYLCLDPPPTDPWA